MPIEKCGNCKFHYGCYGSGFDVFTTCRRFPPQAGFYVRNTNPIGPQGYDGQPVVRIDFWCGEYKELQK